MKFKIFLCSLMISALAFSACSFNLGNNDEKMEPKVEEVEEEDETKVDELEEEIDEKDKELEDLKERLEELEEKVEEEIEEEEEEEVVEEPEKKEEVKAEAYDGPNYITLDSPNDEDTFHEEPITFTGSVSPNTTKVVATAEYGTKVCDGMCLPYNEDVYRLQKFNYGDDSFAYRAKVEYNNLPSHGSADFNFTAYFDDGSTKSVDVTIFYSPGGAEMGKPVIYLYPEETQMISVNVEPTDGISISEPEIGDGWEVIANPEGKIFSLSDRKAYPYLFWEGFASNFETPEEGFVVAEENVERFFDEKLEILGMNKVETADFKEFWVPYLTGDDYYFITFIDQETFDGYAPLSISPEPDSIIRVFFDYKALETPIKVPEQKLLPAERYGFSVIEWGGRLYR